LNLQPSALETDALPLSYSPKYLSDLHVFLRGYSSAVPTEADVYPSLKYLASTMRYELFAAVAVACGGVHDEVARPTPASPPIADSPRQPVASSFGKTENGEIKKQRRFALDGDTVFGWRLKLPCTGPTRFRETLQMPSPGEWGFDATTTTISADQTRSVVVDYSGCFDGWIEHAWSTSRNDPPGEYVLTVEVDGYAPQVFRATFVRPDADQRLP
jgi:hypothetical protein